MKDDSIINLDWINELIKLIPETSSHRKNLIEIAGYPKWENVNSNLLAFYLDEKEEHGFGRLFLNSLIDLYESKQDKETTREIFDTDYIIEREASTDLGGRIDIVVSSDTVYESEETALPSNWSIIIENKLFAELYNNLIDYWDSVNAEQKIGIALTVHPVAPDLLTQGEVTFVNILHKDLVEKVKQNLSEYYLESDDRHLLFLKEYIANVKSYYKDKNKMQNLDKTLELFHSKKEEIKKLKEIEMELLKHVSNALFNIMTEIGYPPNSWRISSKGRHFHMNDVGTSFSEEIKNNLKYAKKFRFWIDIDELRNNNSIKGVFELYGKSNTKYGDKLKERLYTQSIFTDRVSIVTGGKSGAGYQHVYTFTIPIGDFKDVGFSERLKEVLMKEIFNNEKNLIENAVLELKKIMEQEATGDTV
ncbi:MAG: PD-(D/E)XK nuclease family protein [bacterium]